MFWKVKKFPLSSVKNSFKWRHITFDRDIKWSLWKKLIRHLPRVQIYIPAMLSILATPPSLVKVRPVQICIHIFSWATKYIVCFIWVGSSKRRFYHSWNWNSKATEVIFQPNSECSTDNTKHKIYIRGSAERHLAEVKLTIPDFFALSSDEIASEFDEVTQYNKIIKREHAGREVASVKGCKSVKSFKPIPVQSVSKLMEP